MPNVRNILSTLLPNMVIIVLLILPIYIMDRDLWDGVIIEYAYQTNDHIGLKAWLLESGWYFQYWFIKIIFKISSLLEISYIKCNLIFLTTILFILIKELDYLSSIILNFQNPEKLKLKLLYFSSPVLAVLLSSVMTFHILCITLGIYGIRIIHSKNIFKTIIGFICLIPTFNYYSLILLLTFISLFFDNSRLINFKNFKISNKTIYIIIFAILYYLVFRILFPPSGRYEGYNDILFLNFDNFLLFLKNVIKYLTFFIPVFSTLILVFFLNFQAQKQNFQIVKLNRYFSINHEFLIQTIFLLILCFLAIFPYIIVGKGTFFFRTIEWNIRHALPLILPLSLLSIYLDNNFKLNLKLLKYKKISLIFCVLFLINLSFLLPSIIQKTNRNYFERELERELFQIREKLLGGRLQIVGNNIPLPLMRPYEMNFLLYRVKGKNDQWVRIGENKLEDFNIPKYLKNNLSYQKEMIYKYSQSHDYICNVIDIEVIGFKGLKSLIYIFFLEEKQSYIKIKKIESCII